MVTQKQIDEIKKKNRGNFKPKKFLTGEFRLVQ